MKHKSVWIAFSLAFLTHCNKSASSTSSSSAEYDLTLTLNDFSLHAAHHTTIGLFDRTDNKLIAQATAQPNDAGVLEHTFTKSLTAHHDYLIGYYADMDADGVCDEPPADHGWVVKVNDVTGTTTKTDKHRMSFSNPCHLFAATSSEPATTVTLSGQLVVDAQVSGVDGITAGQPIAGATVFAAGFPEQEATTGSDGVFTLKLNVGSALIAPDNIDLLAWYTKAKPGFDPTDWAGADARLGILQTVAINQESIQLSPMDLTWTTALQITVNDNAAQPVDGCWVHIPALSFQLVSEAKKNGVYLLDYLPAGTYTVKAICGSQSGTAEVEIQTATARDALQTATITVQ